MLYEGVVAYVRGGESLAHQIRNPVTELIVTRRDEAINPSVQDRKSVVSSVYHGATLINEGVVTHMRGGESPARQIRNPVTELIVTRRDEAAPLAVKGVAY